jgi:CRISPR-associated protein Csa1
VYFLPDEVRRRLLRRYRKRSREVVVDERLRGWAWEFAPIDPPYDYLLPLSELAGRYCDSMRDIYLRHVEKKKKPTTANMIEGRLYHEAVSLVILNAKKGMYAEGLKRGDELGGFLTQIRDKVLDEILSGTKPPVIRTRGGNWDPKRIRANLDWIWNYETHQIVAAIERILTLQPFIGLDALVNASIPVVSEQKLDGRNLGLSSHLSADAFGVEGVVLDIKTGRRRHFHRLATTGYAMVIESIYEYPVDIGCIVYSWFRDGLPPPIEYDVHTIDEPLRQELLERRDDAMKLIYDQRDPGLPPQCYEDCPFWDECH